MKSVPFFRTVGEAIGNEVAGLPLGVLEREIVPARCFLLII
jgi:hypothetical protein